MTTSKLKQKHQSNEADLSFEELELLAEEARMMMSQGRGCTIREYIVRIESLKSEELGYRICKALMFEPKLESYFPDSVFDALQDRAREERYPVFNKEDDEFMVRNIHKGVEWLKNRFYTNASVIGNRIDVLNLRAELLDEDILILERYEYEQRNEKDRVDGGVI